MGVGGWGTREKRLTEAVLTGSVVVGQVKAWGTEGGQGEQGKRLEVRAVSRGWAAEGGA